MTLYAVASAEEAGAYVGFKHINGPSRWDSLAKAHFAAEWYLAESQSGASLHAIAPKLGDTHDIVGRMIIGAFALEQARTSSVFDIRDRYPE